MKYFVVSDIHSYYSILKKTLKEKGFSEKEDHVLVLLGDAFDRGEETREVADFLLSLYDKDKLIYIIGNHEELMVHCLQALARGDDPRDIAMSYHATNGTWQTLLALANMTENEAIRAPMQLVSRVMHSRVYRELLASCVDYFETKKYVFVHGYIPCFVNRVAGREMYYFKEDWRDADPSEWYRARWAKGATIALEEGIYLPDKTIVCGHWHTSEFHSKYEGKGSEWGRDADFSPFYSKNGEVICIDACTATSKTVNCLVFDSEEL